MIYPLVAMLMLVAIMFSAAFIVRMHAVHRGDVSLSHYQLFEGQPPPSYVTKVCNNLNNLFQVPPVFYAATVLAIAPGIESGLALFSAWGFVGGNAAGMRNGNAGHPITTNSQSLQPTAFGRG